MKRKMLSMNSSVSAPSSSRKYSATVSAGQAPRADALLAARSSGRRSSAAFDLSKSLRSITPDSWNLQPEVVAFTGALAHSGEYGKAAVLGGDVVDEFLNDDGLADAGAAEQADLCRPSEMAGSGR